MDGETLLEFCNAVEIVVGNTWFENETNNFITSMCGRMMAIIEEMR